MIDAKQDQAKDDFKENRKAYIAWLEKRLAKDAEIIRGLHQTVHDAVTDLFNAKRSKSFLDSEHMNIINEERARFKQLAIDEVSFAVAAERDRCAKVCESMAGFGIELDLATKFAKEILATGQKK